jgi:hypothetical protein
MEFRHKTTPTARASHTCTECGREIRAGEKYEKVVGAVDGDLETFKTCRDCLSVRESFFCGAWVLCCIWSDLEDHIQELRGEIPSSCLVPLTSTARKRVCDLIEQAWRWRPE